MPASDNKQPDPFSKTQLKKQMEGLQNLGKELIALSPAQLAQVPLPDNLREAILLAHTLKAHEAKRRHLQYIGKIMRGIDPEPVQAALAKIKFVHKQATKQFHEVEQWRERLIAEGDGALQALCEIYPALDRQSLRQLIRKAQQDRKNSKNTGGETALFKYLKNI